MGSQSSSSLSSLSGLSGASASAASRRQPAGHFQAVSELLGQSAEELAAKVAGGTSLMDVATEAGVSGEDLLQALEDGAPEELRSSPDLREIVTQIAQQTGTAGPGGPGGPGGGRPPGPPPTGALTGSLTSTQESTLEVVGSLLEMDGEDVLEELRSGTSLADLLAAHDVDLSTLASSLQSGMQRGFQVDVRA
ncbi:hypothetical protein [Nocardioides flavescens]|uniref:Uncharacterized protein n=1 Tax=Nocardioides flavescens TaxID=2691959 RepID=A0A6L7F011_9ACTN|nr:hypothetical protein [Nocardioides flavescens]MXG88004.1 hypothetical protein [Nocardioides flavescens]